jgi:hypothetical protein
MMTLEQLTLSGATTLLTYMQCAHLTNNELNASALAATLCEMLNQLEEFQPGVAHNYGWSKSESLPEDVYQEWEFIGTDSEHYPDFDLPSLS